MKSCKQLLREPTRTDFPATPALPATSPEIVQPTPTLSPTPKPIPSANDMPPSTNSSVVPVKETVEIANGPKVCSIDNVGTTVGLTPASQTKSSSSDAKKTTEQSTTNKSSWPFTSNTQMGKMLYKSNELKQILDTWRKFWFPKPGTPTNPNPERIHGGIIRLFPTQPDTIPSAGATLL
jgi:hypothetical protein